ncbi:hypothetical protein [Jeotgalibacillus malaysiensis]|uniref:hypothetical protein n=1 Tax=Jeotgalibacillus malaysiensis TaxID=1508404 RepID=UPI00384FECD3
MNILDFRREDIFQAVNHEIDYENAVITMQKAKQKGKFELAGCYARIAKQSLEKLAELKKRKEHDDNQERLIQRLEEYGMDVTEIKNAEK